MAAHYSTPIGQRFGSLVILGDASRRADGYRRVRALCDCGNISEPIIYPVKAGKTTSCGCGMRPSAHGHSGGGETSPTYRTWRSMKARCSNPKTPSYPEYGGRGITVCKRWENSFEDFLADMGERPVGMTIDRFPDINGNYEPGNCRWVTVRDQQNNRRYTVYIEHNGVKKALTEWAEEKGITAESLYKRIHNYGWTVEKALDTPNRPYIRK